MSEWHYSINGQQFGPVTSSQLKQMAGEGRLSAADLVWREGMKEWAPAGSVPNLLSEGENLSPQAQPPAASPISPIGYYNPSAGLSDRVAKTLKGFPPPTGMQGEWPLSDVHLLQLKDAEKHRKALRSFNSLCQFFTLFGALSSIGAVIAFSEALSGVNSRSIFSAASVTTSAITLLIILGTTVGCYMAGRAALRCRIWGPITIIVLIAIEIIWFFVGMVVASSRTDPFAEMFLPMFFLLLFDGIFLYISIRGLTAIPKFLASPVWAQEALVNAKL